MEIGGKNRQNVTSVKKQSSIVAKRARYLAHALNTDDRIVRKIDTLEQKIQNARLDRKNAKNFCEKEIEQLQRILADLEKRYSRKGARLGLVFCLVMLLGNLIIFIAAYRLNVPKSTYHANPNFYIILGIITYICLSGVLYLYYRAYRWLSIHAVYPLLRVKSSSEKADAFFRWSALLAFGSLFTLSFQQSVIAFATTVPTVFSPNMSLVVLASNLWTTFAQFFNSSPLVAMATFLTLLPFVIACIRKIYGSVLKNTP